MLLLWLLLLGASAAPTHKRDRLELNVWSGFGLLADVRNTCSYHPPPGADNFAAIEHGLYLELFASRNPCGTYISVAGPRGTTAAVVVGFCSACPESSLEITRSVFERISHSSDTGLANGTATPIWWRIMPCPPGLVENGVPCPVLPELQPTDMSLSPQPTPSPAPPLWQPATVSIPPPVDTPGPASPLPPAPPAPIQPLPGFKHAVDGIVTLATHRAGKLGELADTGIRGSSDAGGSGSAIPPPRNNEPIGSSISSAQSREKEPLPGQGSSDRPDPLW